MNVSGLVLCGGASRRMGRDKAFLIAGGETLLARQIRLLQSLDVSEILISGRSDGNYAAYPGAVIQDDVPGCGPLGGIATALRCCRGSHLFVLAVDMPRMETGFLEKVLAAATADTGAVPFLREKAEPLAAIYPVAARAIAHRRIRQETYTMRGFVEECQQQSLIVPVPVAPHENRLFLNWNTPEEAHRPSSGE